MGCIVHHKYAFKGGFQQIKQHLIKWDLYNQNKTLMNRYKTTKNAKENLRKNKPNQKSQDFRQMFVISKKKA
jgi:hypothetical protein